MREICINPKALKKVVRNTRAADIAAAHLRACIEKGVLLPKRHVVFERNNDGINNLENE